MRPEELLQIAQEKGIDITPYKAKLAQGTPKQAPSALDSLMSGSNQSPIAKALMMVAGKNPSDLSGGNDLQKLYAQEAIKNKFEDPRDAQIKDLRIKNLQAGLDTDEQGNPIRVVDLQKAERENRLQDFESRRQASSLRGELNQNTYIKRFQEMNSAATGIDSILSDTISRPDLKSKNIGDQALITLYNKILDPLSVVRESEYARTPEGQALMNRMAGFIQKVQAGGSGLTDSDRIEVARAAKVLINNAGSLYNTKISDYEGLAGSYGVDPSLVTGGFQKFSPYDLEKQYQANNQNNSSGSIDPFEENLKKQGFKIISKRPKNG